jgi:hypothetical protein
MVHFHFSGIEPAYRLQFLAHGNVANTDCNPETNENHKLFESKKRKTSFFLLSPLVKPTSYIYFLFYHEAKT